eukprot:COSAG06_NODE_21611_length_751_cov_0.926380_1_plen_34_part_10
MCRLPLPLPLLRTGGGAEDVDLHVITRRLEEGKL